MDTAPLRRVCWIQLILENGLLAVACVMSQIALKRGQRFDKKPIKTVNLPYSIGGEAETHCKGMPAKTKTFEIK